jgi:exopolyphosphatase/guanosine-5'-triphosphate,3'-diphosphate pyrophosphatase
MSHARSQDSETAAAVRAQPMHGPAYAALDLGTNNVRLLVGTPSAEGFRVIDSVSRIVRLGEGLQEHGALGPDAMQRAIDALQLCADRLARRRIAATRAIATEACRRAANGRAFLDRVRRETGLQFDVISAREEAELAIESCAPLLGRLFAKGVRRALLLDIGGGSTELGWVRLVSARDPPELIGTISLPLGVIDVAEAWGGGDVAPDAFDTTVTTLAGGLLEFDSVHRIGQEIRHGGVAMVGTSGTVTTLAGVVLGLQRYRRPLVDGVMMPVETALRAVRQLRAMSQDALMRHPCVGPDRASFVLPGCAIFSAVHRLWPVPLLMVADRGLREGMLLRLMREGQGRAHPTARPSPRASAADAA